MERVKFIQNERKTENAVSHTHTKAYSFHHCQRSLGDVILLNGDFIFMTRISFPIRPVNRCRIYSKESSGGKNMKKKHIFIRFWFSPIPGEKITVGALVQQCTYTS